MADLLQNNELENHTLLTVKEVREVFGIARSTVYRWIDRCWLRKAGQVHAPEDHRNQKIVLLELADEDLQDQFEAWVRAERENGRSPRFFIEDLAQLDPLPDDEIDARDDSKRLVGELDKLMGKLDQESEERERLVEELDSVPAIEPSGLKQAKKGLKEIVDLLKEISDREDDLREETVELPKDLDLPPQAKESEEFTRELGEEEGKGLEPAVSEEELAGEFIQELEEEEIAEFAFLADPETINEEGEWIELNIDELESPFLKEEFVALDEKFLPGAKRRGIEIDFNKGILSEIELDELSAARESANESGEGDLIENSLDNQDEQNDSWLGISIPAEEMEPEAQSEVPCDPTGDWLGGEELQLLQSGVEGEDAEGFYLDGEELKAEALEPDSTVESENLELDLLPEDEGWAAEVDDTTHVDAGAPDLDFESGSIHSQTPEASDLPEPEGGTIHGDPMPEAIEPETGISEAMLTGEDAVELEPDDEVLKLEEAYETEAEEFEDVLAEVDQVSSPSEETPEEAPEEAIEELSREGHEEEELQSLDDLEGETLMSLDDLDEALDFAVEIEEDEDEPLSVEDLSIQIEEEEPGEETFTSVEAEGFDEPGSIHNPLVLEELELEANDETAEPAAESPDEDQGTEIAMEEIGEEPEMVTPIDAPQEAKQEEEPIPVAANQRIESGPVREAPAQVSAPALDMEVLASSAEMIKEGMIGIRLSILEVKEGLGILQDPVDSVSRNTEKVSEGVLEIVSEARETRRALEDLGARLENLGVSPLRAVASQDSLSGGTFITAVGLTLLVISWCLGLYLRSQGNAMSLYAVFGANLLITIAILMLRSPREVPEE